MDIQNGITTYQGENRQNASRTSEEIVSDWMEQEELGEKIITEGLKKAFENPEEYRKHMWENPY